MRKKNQCKKSDIIFLDQNFEVMENSVKVVSFHPILIPKHIQLKR